MQTAERHSSSGIEMVHQTQVDDTAAVAAIARRIDAELREALAKLVRHATELAVAAVEAMVGRDAQLARRALESALREAVTSLAGSVKLRIVVHPSQLSAAQQLAAQLQQGVQVTVEPDEHISPGGCIVTSDLGEVDATIPGRLRRLREALQEEIDL